MRFRVMATTAFILWPRGLLQYAQRRFYIEATDTFTLWPQVLSHNDQRRSSIMATDTFTLWSLAFSHQGHSYMRIMAKKHIHIMTAGKVRLESQQAHLPCSWLEKRHLETVRRNVTKTSVLSAADNTVRWWSVHHGDFKTLKGQLLHTTASQQN